MLDWVLHMTATGTLAVVFVLSVNHKVRGFARFAASLAAYRLFPAGLSRSAAVMVIVMEVAAIVALFTPSGEGMWIAFGLLTLYSLALAINLLRGNTAIDCGCGDLPTPISGWLLLRNGFLLVLAMEQSPGIPGGPAGWLLVLMLVIVLSLLYQILEQLLANQHIEKLADSADG